MRLISLIRAAMDAELLHVKRSGRGVAIQAAYGIGALIFGILMLVMLHIAAIAALMPSQGAIWSPLIVGFVDLVLLVILGLMARHPPADPVALEAVAIRRAAMRQVTETASQAMIMAPLIRSQTAKKGLIGAVLTAAVVGFFARR